MRLVGDSREDVYTLQLYLITHYLIHLLLSDTDGKALFRHTHAAFVVHLHSDTFIM